MIAKEENITVDTNPDKIPNDPVETVMDFACRISTMPAEEGQKLFDELSNASKTKVVGAKRLIRLAMGKEGTGTEAAVLPNLDALREFCLWTMADPIEKSDD